MRLEEILKTMDVDGVKVIALKGGLIDDLTEDVHWRGYLAASDATNTFVTFVATQEDAVIPEGIPGEKVEFQIETAAGQTLYCVEFH